MPRSRQRRSLQRSTALAMAGLYALLAMAGQGLHGLTHGLGGCPNGCCVAQPSDPSACECCETECPLAKREAQRNTDRTHTAFRAPAADGHDPHKCSVCSLLAQLKVGRGPAPVEATASAAPADFVLSLRSTLASTILSTLGARGPPAIA